MNIDDTSESKYLKKTDVDNNGRGTLLTIVKIVMENVAPPNKNEEVKPVIFFAEVEKGFVCGAKVNKESIKAITNTGETSQWIGQKVVLFCDPNVMNLSGQRVGGIRVRAPRNQPPAQTQQPARPAAPTAPPPPDDSDDVPF